MHVFCDNCGDGPYDTEFNEHCAQCESALPGAASHSSFKTAGKPRISQRMFRAGHKTSEKKSRPSSVGDERPVADHGAASHSSFKTVGSRYTSHRKVISDFKPSEEKSRPSSVGDDRPAADHGADLSPISLNGLAEQWQQSADLAFGVAASRPSRNDEWRTTGSLRGSSSPVEELRPGRQINSIIEAQTHRESYVLLCLEGRGYEMNLHHLDTGGLNIDADLFRRLREFYYQNRPKSILPMRLLVGIHFVKFVVRHDGQVDNLERDRLPMAWSDTNAIEYTCTPRAVQNGPPLGSRWMLRHFHQPSCGEGSKVCLQQFPMRSSKLEVAAQEAEVVAYGLLLEERLNSGLMSRMMILICIVGGLLFGVIYGVLMHDMGGGFTVSAWATTCVGLGLQFWIFGKRHEQL